MLELMPWRPLREVGVLRRDMEDMMKRFFSEPFSSFVRADEWVPSVDIKETDGQITVKAELPGLEVKDIDLTVSGDLLTIKGEKGGKEETKEKDYYCREIYCGSFQRSFRLPAEVDSQKVDATFKDGVLTVTMPKAESGSRKKIEIKA